MVFSEENIHTIKAEALSKIGNTNKSREIYQCVSNWPISKKEKEIDGSDDSHYGWGENRGLNSIGDYDLCGNHGLKRGETGGQFYREKSIRKFAT